MRRIAVFLAPVLLLVGCATTTEPGWQGNGAKPFDGARASCQAQVQAISDPAQSAAAFEACMRTHGWTRGTSG